MRKKLVIVCAILLLLTLTLCSCSSSMPNAQKGDVKDYSSEVLNKLAILSSTYANRTAGSDAEKVFVQHISDYMTTLGYNVETQEYILVDENKTSYNVICSTTYDENKKNIVIGCQYDNCYEFFDAHPDGAYESGMAIATLMQVSEILISQTLDYNITIVYFGGGVQSWSGADNFVEKFDKKVHLMINYSMLGGGDNLYIYSRDKAMNYNDVFYATASVNNLDFKKVPQYKRLLDTMIYEDSMYTYTHIGMFGNHYAFMNKSIPSVAYFAMNWEDQTNAAFTEIKGMSNVFETEHDTYANMIKRTGSEKLAKNINSVINSTILTLVSNKDILNEALSSPDEMPTWALSNAANFFGGIAVRILIVAIIIIIVNMAKNYVVNNRDKYKDYMQNISVENKTKEDIIVDPFDESQDVKNDDSSGDVFQ